MLLHSFVVWHLQLLFVNCYQSVESFNVVFRTEITQTVVSVN
jgi:hypothetical protein